MRPQVFSTRYVASFAGNLCIETQRIALIDLPRPAPDSNVKRAALMPVFFFVQWRAGQGSLHDVHPRMLGPAHIGIHVTGSGGGFLDNNWVWGADHNQSFGSAHIPGRWVGQQQRFKRLAG